MSIAVVILNWNGLELLQKYLLSVIAGSEQANLYIIDNNSSDSSVEWLQMNHPQIKVIQFHENYGFAKAYNLAIKQIKEEFVCCLNSDVRVSKNWLQPMVALLKSNPKIAAVQPKILDDKQPNTFEYAGAAGGFLDNFGYPFCRGRIFWSLEKDVQQYQDNLPIDWATGAAVLIRKSAFLEVSGFDEDFFMHQEEIDLCWRLKNANYLIYYCGESCVYHLGGGTLQENNPKKTYMNFRNNLLMLTKNLPKNKLFFVLLVRLVLDGLTALVFWRYHGFGHLLAIAKSHISFYRLFNRFYKKRQRSVIQNYASKTNVPWQYFALKRKNYQALK